MSELRALSFGRAAEHYERGRPVWPAEALEVVHLPASAHVLDLGAGTGKLTRLLVERFAKVTAVEPDDAMRALNRWGDVLAGSAERIPLTDGEADAVFCGESFHWFAHPAAVAEIARVLRPGGTLVLLWTHSDGDWTPPLPELDALFDRLRATLPASRGADRLFSGAWREAFDGAPFESFRETRLATAYVAGRDELLSYLLSQSSIAARSSEEVEAIHAELESIVPIGRYSLPFRVDVYTTRRR